MIVQIKQLPAFDTAYVRHTGSYFEPSNHWGKLGEWAVENGLYPPEQQFIGISLDDPSQVEDENCRHDACVTIPADFKKERHNDVQFKTIDGGLYAFYSFYDTSDQLNTAYQYLYKEWLPVSPYKADHTRYNLEWNLNDPTSDPDGKCRVDLCIPVKSL